MSDYLWVGVKGLVVNFLAALVSLVLFVIISIPLGLAIGFEGVSGALFIIIFILVHLFVWGWLAEIILGVKK